jgi:hypothetical protein
MCAQRTISPGDTDAAAVQPIAVRLLKRRCAVDHRRIRSRNPPTSLRRAGCSSTDSCQRSSHWSRGPSHRSPRQANARSRTLWPPARTTPTRQRHSGPLTRATATATASTAKTSRARARPKRAAEKDTPAKANPGTRSARGRTRSSVSCSARPSTPTARAQPAWRRRPPRPGPLALSDQGRLRPRRLPTRDPPWSGLEDFCTGSGSGRRYSLPLAICCPSREEAIVRRGE